jgi:hypothetical protein
MLETAELEGSQGQNPQSCSGHPQVADSWEPSLGLSDFGGGRVCNYRFGGGRGGGE